MAIGLIGYLVSSLFLHGAYLYLLWLQVASIIALRQLARSATPAPSLPEKELKTMSSSVIVLAYHHIALPGNLDLAPTVIDAYPSDFEEQMRYVAAHYNVISSVGSGSGAARGLYPPAACPDSRPLMTAICASRTPRFRCWNGLICRSLSLSLPIIPISRGPSSGGIPSIGRWPGPRAPRSRCRGGGSAADHAGGAP